MCGFVIRISNKKLKNHRINKIKKALESRGPDNQSYINYSISPKINLEMIHTRLEIVGLGNEGNQPLQNKQNILVFNGEIYNYKKLNEFLSYKSISSDSKTLLELSSNHKIEDVVKKLRGIYSFGIYSKKFKKLYLNRDHFGTKPLYFAKDKDQICFSSNLQALREAMDDYKLGELTELGNFFFLLYGFIPRDTKITKDLQEIEPGKLFTIDLENFDFNNPKINISKVIVEPIELKSFEEEILESYESDVPIAILLSGGTDSAFVANLTRKLKRKQHVETYTLKNNSGFNKEDVFTAKEISKKLGLKNNLISIEEKDIKESISRFIKNMEYPTDDGLNIFLCSERISKDGFKVCLTGLGGDEFFGGYSSSKKNIFKSLISKSFLWKNFDFIKKIIFKRGLGGYSILNTLNKSEIDGFANSKAFIFNEIAINKVTKAINVYKKILKNLVPYNFNTKYELSNKINLLELYGYCIPQLVKDSDIFGMSNSLEIRPCFLIKSFLSEIIDNKTISKGFYNKKLIKKKMDLDINSLITKNKLGFTIDIEDFLKNNLDLITNSIKLSRMNFYLKDEIKLYKGLIKSKKSPNNRLKYLIWRGFILAEWQKLN